MHAGGNAFPPPDHDAQKRGLQHEGHGGFKPQEVTENVASRRRKNAPVGPELKFHGDSGDHPHGEVEDKKFGPEPAMPVIFAVLGFEPEPFHHNQEDAEPDGEHRPQDVEHGREGELNP